MDPDASPAPRLDIAGDAFSSFAAGEDAKANATWSETEDEDTRDAGTSASLEAELADLELDLAAFEAALKSGGRALRRATSRETGEEGGGPGTATPIRTTNPEEDALSFAKKREKTNERPEKQTTFEPPPSASTAWWDVDIDERAYRPASSRTSTETETREAERRRDKRRARRVSYFRTNISVRAASVRVARRAEAEVLARLAPSSPLDARVFDSRSLGPAAYGVALAALCKEQNLGDVRGEGTFSDVYAVEPASAPAPTARPGDWAFAGDAAPGFDRGPPRFVAEAEVEDFNSKGSNRAVIKCSTPFPGVVNGRATGDGLRAGETEALVLASLPRHPNVVRLLAAFLSRERNESYLLLADAGANLHAMRERGEVSPRDVRAHARATLRALAHCHANGVVHRDVKGGNVLVGDASSASSASSGDVFPSATLIDFGVARHARLGADTEPASRYGTPGYQAPELLMSDMSLAERRATCDLYAKVDVFALGCTLFFLCVGKELFGATPGGDGDELGARTKTKARAQATQDALEAALEKADLLAGSPRDRGGVEEGMVVLRREKREVSGVSGTSTSQSGRANAFAAAALERALGGAAARAELESRETEAELDVAMLASMAEFPGYEPRTPEEIAFVERAYGAPAPAPAPAHRESLAAFVNRKVTPRQPPGFASLIGACLARDPEDRPSAAEALNWPGAWVELDDDEA
jgi:serine/threonine protein kinase